MQQLQTYDKDNIAPSVVAAIRPYLDRKEFEPEVRPSRAAHHQFTHARFGKTAVLRLFGAG